MRVQGRLSFQITTRNETHTTYITSIGDRMRKEYHSGGKVTLLMMPVPRELTRGSVVRTMCIYLTISVCWPWMREAMAQSLQDEYEKTIQSTLSGIYSQKYAQVELDLKKLEELRPDAPAPVVYRELMDSWKAEDDPGNDGFVRDFQRDSDAAIQSATNWTNTHPDDPEGWRYLASAYGQKSQFAATVLSSPWTAMRCGGKMHDAIVHAQAIENSRGKPDPDTALGVGSFDYFTSKVPVVVKPIAYLFGFHGAGRDKGLEEIQTAMVHGPHSKIEAAMALAGAYYSEAQYQPSRKTLDEEILQAYPNLLSVRTWEIGGCICEGNLEEGLNVIQRTEATSEAWKDFQRGRIALAKSSLNGKNETYAREAERLFSKAIQEADEHSNRSIVTWAYMGRDMAREQYQPNYKGDSSWRTSPLVELSAIPLADHIFHLPLADHIYHIRSKCPSAQ
jgi:hypothetical protein